MKGRKSGPRCPGCNGRLKEAYAEANYGRVLLLDQCGRCGGVWFDRFELYFARKSSLQSLARVDLETLVSENPGAKGSGSCPVCEEELVHFNDPGLPEDAAIRRCPVCSGLWLNRGELKRFGQEKRRPGAGAVPLQTLRRLQKELDTAGLLSREESRPPDPEPVDAKEVAKDMVFLALQALVRILFKF